MTHTNTRRAPYGIAVGPDGNLWFTENASSKIGRITPAGSITEFPLPSPSEPLGITAGPDGNLWFTETYPPAIGRITPAGSITEFPLPPSPCSLTHTGICALEIVAGPDGNLWFTERDSGKIGRITTGAPPPSAFFTVAPCRVVDTRNPDGPFGGPALVAGVERVFSVAGECGVSATAKAVSLNLTVTEPTAAGNLKLYPAGTSVVVSTINYVAGLTRANNTVVKLGETGALAVRCAQASGTAHFVLDVNGYFE